MIKLFVSPSCSSCRKAHEFFASLHIPFREVNILSGDLTKEDVKEILMKSDYGTDEIISTRSKIMKEQKIDIENMTVPQLVSFIVAHPTIMKRPIIVDDRKIQVGYDSEEITAFIPAKYQKIFDQMCASCPYAKACDLHRMIADKKIVCEDCKDHCEK